MLGVHTTLSSRDQLLSPSPSRESMILSCNAHLRMARSERKRKPGLQRVCRAPLPRTGTTYATRSNSMKRLRKVSGPYGVDQL